MTKGERALKDRALEQECNRWRAGPHVGVAPPLRAMDRPRAALIASALAQPGGVPPATMEYLCRDATAWALEFVHATVGESQRVTERALDAMEASGRVEGLPAAFRQVIANEQRFRDAVRSSGGVDLKGLLAKVRTAPVSDLVTDGHIEPCWTEVSSRLAELKEAASDEMHLSELFRVETSPAGELSDQVHFLNDVRHDYYRGRTDPFTLVRTAGRRVQRSVIDVWKARQTCRAWVERWKEWAITNAEEGDVADMERLYRATVIDPRWLDRLIDPDAAVRDLARSAVQSRGGFLHGTPPDMAGLLPGAGGVCKVWRDGTGRVRAFYGICRTQEGIANKLAELGWAGSSLPRHTPKGERFTWSNRRYASRLLEASDRLAFPEDLVVEDGVDALPLRGLGVGMALKAAAYKDLPSDWFTITRIFEIVAANQDPIVPPVRNERSFRLNTRLGACELGILEEEMRLRSGVCVVVHWHLLASCVGDVLRAAERGM